MHTVASYFAVNYDTLGKEHIYLGSPFGKQVGALPRTETVVKVALIAAMVIGIAVFATGCVALGGVLTPTAVAELSRLCFYISTIASGLSMTSIELCLFLLSVGGSLFIAGAIATIRGKIKDRQLMKKTDILYHKLGQTPPLHISEYGPHKLSCLFRRLRLLYAHYEADRILEKLNKNQKNESASLLHEEYSDIGGQSEDSLKKSLQSKLKTIETNQLAMYYHAVKDQASNDLLNDNCDLKDLKAWIAKHQAEIDQAEKTNSIPIIYTENREFRTPIFVGTSKFFSTSIDSSEESDSSTEEESD